jgi:FkbM family methyltransferase
MIKTLSAVWDLRLERGHSFLGSLITRGGVVIDAGAHRCEFANALAEKYGVSVISLEPNEALTPTYIHPNVTLLKVALAAQDGNAVFAIDENPEASRLIAMEGAAITGTVVQTRSLASLLDEAGVRELELLKLDAEGAEYDALLKSPEEVLTRVKQISVEFHPYDPQKHSDLARINDTITQMKEYGFDAVRCSFRGFGDVLLVNRRFDARINGLLFPLVRKLKEITVRRRYLKF